MWKHTRKKRRPLDEPTCSDSTLLLDVEDLIHIAMGPAEQNVVNFKLVQTILYILARHMRLLEQRVEVTVAEGPKPPEAGESRSGIDSSDGRSPSRGRLRKARSSSRVRSKHRLGSKHGLKSSKSRSTHSVSRESSRHKGDSDSSKSGRARSATGMHKKKRGKGESETDEDERGGDREGRGHGRKDRGGHGRRERDERESDSDREAGRGKHRDKSGGRERDKDYDDREGGKGRGKGKEGGKGGKGGRGTEGAYEKGGEGRGGEGRGGKERGGEGSGEEGKHGEGGRGKGKAKGKGEAGGGRRGETESEEDTDATGGKDAKGGRKKPDKGKDKDRGGKDSGDQDYDEGGHGKERGKDQGSESDRKKGKGGDRDKSEESGKKGKGVERDDEKSAGSEKGKADKGRKGGEGRRGGEDEDEDEEDQRAKGGKGGKGEKGEKGGTGGRDADKDREKRGGKDREDEEKAGGKGKGGKGKQGSRTSIAVSEVTRDSEKVLVVGKTTKPAGVQPMRVGSVEVVSQKQFQALENAVKALQDKTTGPPPPTMPDNKKLRSAISKGSASLTDTMQAMNLSKRVQAAETAIQNMGDMLTQLAASGVLPQDVAGKLKSDIESTRKALAADAKAAGVGGKAGGPGKQFAGGPGGGPGGQFAGGPGGGPGGQFAGGPGGGPGGQFAGGPGGGPGGQFGGGPGGGPGGQFAGGPGGGPGGQFAGGPGGGPGGQFAGGPGGGPGGQFAGGPGGAPGGQFAGGPGGQFAGGPGGQFPGGPGGPGGQYAGGPGGQYAGGPGGQYAGGPGGPGGQYAGGPGGQNAGGPGDQYAGGPGGQYAGGPGDQYAGGPAGQYAGGPGGPGGAGGPGGRYPTGPGPGGQYGGGGGPMAKGGVSPAGLGSVTNAQMNEALEFLRQDMLKHMSAMSAHANQVADIASNNVKSIGDKMGMVTTLNNRITSLQSLVNDYAEQLAGFDSGLTTQMSGFQEQVTMMRIDLTAGLQQLEQVNNNAETAAVLELTERYEALVDELDATLHAHSGLTAHQRQLSDELKNLIEAVEMMREQKADRDEVLDGLRDKADSSRLEGLLSEEKFAKARQELESRMQMCYDKFRKQDTIWMTVVHDFTQATDTKAELMQLLGVRDETQEQLRMMLEKVQMLEKMLGDPKAAVVTRKLAKDAVCASCRVPALMSAVTPLDPPALPGLRPQPLGAPADTTDLCMRELLLREEEGEHGKPLHMCQRWVGGSHTLIGPGGRVTREKATPLPLSGIPVKRFLGAGNDGKLYNLQEEMEPCVQCIQYASPTRAVSEEKLPGEPDLPMPDEGGGDQDIISTRRVTVVDTATARRVTIIDEGMIKDVEAGEKRDMDEGEGDATKVVPRRSILNTEGKRRSTITGSETSYPTANKRASLISRSSHIVEGHIADKVTEVGVVVKGTAAQGAEEKEREALKGEIHKSRSRLDQVAVGTGEGEVDAAAEIETEIEQVQLE